VATPAQTAGVTILFAQLQSLVIQQRFCQQPFELGILRLQFPQPLGILNIYTAELALQRQIDR